MKSEQQKPQVKIAFDQKKSKGAIKDKGSIHGGKAKKPQEMLSYGWANNHPTVPANFMKTFNVTVPSKEVDTEIANIRYFLQR